MILKIKKGIHLKVLEKYGYKHDPNKNRYIRAPKSLKEVTIIVDKKTKVIYADWCGKYYNISGFTGVKCLENAGLIETMLY